MTTTTGFQIRGWHVAAGVTAFFALVIAVDGVFLTLAYRTHPGQVAVKPYEAGLIYNARLAQERSQALLGWKASAAVEGGNLVVGMQDRAGSPLSGLDLTATLQRPATTRGETRLRLTETGPGQYVGAADLPSGAWDTHVVARDGQGRIFEAERRLTWP